MKSTETVVNEQDPGDDLDGKTDALERTILGSLKASEDLTHASVLVQRKPGGDFFLCRALDRVLSRLNIKTAAGTLSNSIREGLKAQTASSTKPSLYRFKVSSPQARETKRIVEILISTEKLLIKVGGAAPVLGGGEEVMEVYFKDQDLPGKQMADGTIDFRELNRYPSVSRDDALLRVRSDLPQRDGVTYDGKAIPATGGDGGYLSLKAGVFRMDLTEEGEVPCEYLVKAEKDGVTILEKEDGRITGIGVNDTIRLKQIDYSVGNIGSEMLCPVSMDVDLVQSGFQIKVNGEVTVKDLDGGTVVTNSNATFDQIQKNSEVRASGNIQTNTVISSSLSAETGGITVKKEMRDSRLAAARVEIKNSRGMLANVDMDTDNLDILNVAVGGTNSVNLGKHLFEKREELLLEKKMIEKQAAENDRITGEIKAKLFEWLKKLSDLISADKEALRKSFKELLETLRLSTFDDTYPILADLGPHLHRPTVEQVKKRFKRLEEHLEKIAPITERVEALGAELADTVNRINRIGFDIKATLKSTASIEILCHNEKPYLILPSQGAAEEFIRYSGHYTLEGGLVVKKL